MNPRSYFYNVTFAPLAPQRGEYLALLPPLGGWGGVSGSNYVNVTLSNYSFRKEEYRSVENESSQN